MDYAYVAAGLALLLLGGEGLVRGSVAVAERLNLSTLLVSMVIVGFGTSAPELMVSTAAALKGAPNIALGNVVGSNIANILLILGMSAVIAPLACTRPEIMRDALAVLVASFALVGLAQHGMIGRLAGFIMVAALGAYLSYAYLTERKASRRDEVFRERIAEDLGKPGMGLATALTLCVLGLVFLVAGAHLLVEGATAIARRFGISNAVIGLSLVAVGTSLPELATAAISAYRKHQDVVIGNIIGSNLFNILGILGVTGIVVPIPIEGRIADIDIWIMLAVAIALAPIIWTGRVISRVEGGAFLTLYVVYMAWLFGPGA
jgi:cation:H+ antiporter